MCNCGAGMKDEIYALLRVVTGFVFLFHGWEKVFVMGVDNFTGMMLAELPASGLLGYIVSYGEILAGLALILGVFTHWAGKFYVIIMLGAIFLVHADKGYSVMNGGYEYQLILLVLGLLFMTHGAGKYSLETKLGKKCDGNCGRTCEACQAE